MVIAMVTLVDMTFWARIGEVELIFLSWCLYKAVCCSVDIMVCDVKEREGCIGKIGRGSKREREKHMWTTRAALEKD